MPAKWKEGGVTTETTEKCRKTCLQKKNKLSQRRLLKSGTRLLQLNSFRGERKVCEVEVCEKFQFPSWRGKQRKEKVQIVEG